MNERTRGSRGWSKAALACAGLAVAGLLAWLGWRWLGPAPRARSATLAGPAHEILPGSGLYFLGTDSSYSYSAGYALDTPAGIVVVDPGLRSTVVQQAFASLGLDTSRIRIILITHLHADHWFAARELVDRTGATVMALRAEAASLTHAADLGLYYSSHSRPITDVPVLSDVRPLDNGQKVRLGGTEIEVIATPGHTGGSACYRARVRGRWVVWSGDTVLTLSPGSLGGAYMTRLGPRYGGDMPSYLSSLTRLRQLRADIVLPGHPAFGTELNPCVGAAGWHALLDPAIARLDGWLRDHAREAAVFLDADPRAITPEILYLGAAHGIATYALRTADGFIAVDPGHADPVALLSGISRLTGAPARVCTILITASHPDHWESAGALRAATGAELVSGAMPRGVPGAENPDRVLRDGDEFERGGVRLKALSCGRNAKGGALMSYLTRISGRLVVIGGDNVERFPLGPHEEYHEADGAPDPAGSLEAARFYKFLKRQPVELVLAAHPRCDEAPFYLPGEWELRTARW